MNHPVVPSQSYGKSQVRLSRIQREVDHHDFFDLTFWIELDGDFVAAYTEGDNSNVVATDTMKNTIYVLASKHRIETIESFTQLVCRHFLATYPQVNRAEIRCEEKLWARMQFNASSHEHAFLGGSSERNHCIVIGYNSPGQPDPSLMMKCGFSGLQVLKTTGSGFTKFWRDDLTTLPETDDRIFATTITAAWQCTDATGQFVDWTSNWSEIRQTARAAMLKVFADQYSKSVQHTLYEMGRAALEICPLIGAIEITMPNQHHLLANLAPFGLQNPNEVFVPTSEPFGNISATIARDRSKEKS